MWKSNKHPEDGEVTVMDMENGCLIAEVYGSKGEEDKRGALISAAPDLLEALKAVASEPTSGEYESEYDGRVYTLCSGCNFQDDVRPQHSDDCIFMKARAAIAKAEAA